MSGFDSGFDASEFVAIFIQEATEQIEALDQALVGLERNPADAALVDIIFRAAHSLKASAASQGYEAMSQVAHAMESLLDRVRSGALQVSADLVDLLLGAVDALKGHLGCVTAGQTDFDECTGLIRDLGQFASPGPGRRTDKPAAEAGPVAIPDGAVGLRIRLAEDCAMPAARAWLALKQLGDHGRLLASEPTMEALQGAEEVEIGDIVVVVETATPPEELAARARAVAEVAQVEVLSAQPEMAAADKLPSPVGAERLPTQGAGPAEQQTVRVSVEHFDALMNLVGELVISRTRLSALHERFRQAAGDERRLLMRDFEEITGAISQVVIELQERVQKVRMVPIEQVFMRFPRLIRDAARRAGKQVEFVIEGGDTELDSSLIQKITDPLKHLLRNSVGHGIEPPEQRLAAGKPTEGRVALRAYQEAGGITIEVSDDGAGIDPARLREAAVRKGVLSYAQAAALSDQQALQLIFGAGFSTAEQVSDVSGRGVGMDVVRGNLEEIGGQVEVTSEIGVGTTVRLRLPLTLAIIRALLVSAAGIVFALPIGAVQFVRRVTRDEVGHVKGQPAITIAGRAVPLAGLAELGGLLRTDQASAERLLVVVVVAGDVELGLVVDGILATEELVIQPLGHLLRGSRIAAGAALLGDGRTALVADVPVLVETWRRSEAALVAA